MALDLKSNDGPLSLTDDALQDVFEDLQGNVLNGHGRDQAVLLFLQFSSTRIDEAKEQLAVLGAHWVTSAKAQLAAAEQFKATGDDGGLFVHVALSAAGYRALGVAADRIPSGAALRNRPAQLTINDRQVTFYERDVFAQGMKARRAALQDPAEAQWEEGLRADIHALVIIADDSNTDLINGEAQLRTMFEANATNPIARVVSTQRGFGLRRRFFDREGEPKFGENVEHFGYVDGRSQPALLDTQLDADVQRDGRTVWDPVAPPRLVLLDDPGGTPGVSFGSFLVFRKLEQNVKGFKQAQHALAEELKLPTKLVGAMAVGRFEDGTPVVLQPGEGGEPPAANDFNYSSDAAGVRCPLQAHIRKTNPRLESVDPEGNFAKDRDEELGHRIARRGIPYGGGLSDFTELNSLPERGVGLLFMCYQSDIWEQFEFMQRFWCDNDKFLQPGLKGNAEGCPDYVLNTGMDAIIGQQEAQIPDPITGFAAPPTKWPCEWGQRTASTSHSIARFVTMRGGEYFFSPSLTFLRSLSSGEISAAAELMPTDLSSEKPTGAPKRLPT